MVRTYVESLCGPEHQYGEEICAGNEGDDQCECEEARFLPQSLGEHGELCSIPFPNEKCCKEHNAEDEGCERVRGAPSVLVSVKGVSKCVHG